jgi:urease accessory protein
MQLITAPLSVFDSALPEVAMRADRHTLAKRIWRGSADDGTDFGFELATPLRSGDSIYQTAAARYVVLQMPEPLLEISLNITPAAAAGIGWAIGNLHLELSAEAARLLAPDEPPVRQLLARIDVPFQTITAVFRPGRFIRGNQPTHELGSSHKH